MGHASFIIGIDLGTTNCTMAYTSLHAKGAHHIEQAPIAQMMVSNVQDVDFSLPSFIYFPLEEELKAKVAALKWKEDCSFAIGTFARNRGGEVPSCLISSAKSWLCHAGIDRREKLLPFEAEASEKQMSPLEASSQILQHLKEAWDFSHPDAPFVEQQILITVPASFDPSARQLVQEAAEIAGYPEITLLEEPQAAFYAWLHTHAEDWRKLLKVGDCVLVVDIGGGTTDFSLISVEEEQGNLFLKRIAVGSHLLLGGDNIDLGLAYVAQQKFEAEGHQLDSWQFQSLIHQCRQAKETLLGENPPKGVDITVLGRGSRLIGNTLKTELTQEEVQKFVVESFIPLVNLEERSSAERRSGIQQIGLPYVQDPRISCQLAKFLSMSGESEKADSNKFILPSAVLFNGGTMKSSALRHQLLKLLNQWAMTLNKHSVKELPDADYDFAVSRGAAYYALARQGEAIRIRGGTSRSYFIGVEDAAPAVPGISPPVRAICIVPFGMEEGEERVLSNQEFALLLGEQASFRFFSHSTPTLSDGTEPTVGTVLRNWKEELSELHPIETLLEKKSTDSRTVRVKLKSKVTELGFLELWCEAPDGRKWKLEFDIRTPEGVVA
jgi:hypothetical protein